MGVKRNVVSLLLVVIGIMSVVVLAGADAGRPDRLAGLTSEDAKERLAVGQRIRQERAETEAALIAFLENQLKIMPQEQLQNSAVAIAIDTLGDLRSVKAIPILIQLLPCYFDDGSGVMQEPITIFQVHLATPALVKIGMPAIDPVFAHAQALDPTTQERVLRLCGHIISEVLGKQAALLEIKRQQRFPSKDSRAYANLDFMYRECEKLQSDDSYWQRQAGKMKQ